MKKRIRIDLIFPETFDTTKLMQVLSGYLAHTENINEGKVNMEVSRIELEECMHDEGKSCRILARYEKPIMEIP